MRRIPLWVEPYAGSLAVGLRLMGAPCPLVGWMGSKGAYHGAITSILQVSAADEVWCADVSDWANVWRALARPGVAKAAADIIDEIEADALSTGDSPRSYRRVWMALREEWREAGTTVDARGVARWVALVVGSALQRGPSAGSKFPEAESHRTHPRDGHTVAERFGPRAERLEQMIGAKLADLLEPLMVGPVTRRPSEAGAAIEVYPLALPDGEGASIPLGQWGEVGFANHDGLLVLTVPWSMAGWLRQRLGDAIVRGPEAGLSMDGSARVAEAWVRLRPGMRASVPLGALGECGVEAAR